MASLLQYREEEEEVSTTFLNSRPDSESLSHSTYSILRIQRNRDLTRVATTLLM
jgi:hypothetical protein